MPPDFPRQFGNYTLLAEMPKGGMGALYLGCRGEGGMEKLCVVKTVLPHLADKEYTARFKDEAKVVVRLSHGNIVPVFDAGFVGQELFMAMELVDGRDLRAVWNACAKKGIAFPVDVAVYLARELARGLHHAHTFAALKLVHRDVSPPNVLLSYFGEVKLTDFGLASSTLKSEKTAPGIVYGKISYMSPEQARGEPLDGRTDLYAVGIILWELLTGRQMFPNSEQNVIQRVRNPEVPAPSTFASRVPAPLDAIVMKSLAKDRTLRYADCEAFRAALAGFLAQAAPTTDNTSVAEFMKRLFGDEIEDERNRRQVMIDAFGASRLAAAVSQEQDQTSSQPTTVSLTPKEPPQGTGVIGTYLDGRYLVRRLIGEGGMGLVYEAEHVEIGRRVAVKILHAAYTRQAEVVARFRSEARAATRIGHPHIIDVFDSGTTVDGAVYFVMEYLDGIDLAQLISKNGTLPVERAVRICREICQALAAAHKAGIIHRDMKPENVFLVERDGQKDFVKVLDFGIAKTLEAITERQGRLTTPGMAMGTPEYMAPEQAAGANADGRADVYAVGAILYETLTGRPPHEGGTIMEVLTKKATEKPIEVETLRPDVPLELARLVIRCLSTSPDDRPQSMDALASDLGRLSGTVPQRPLPSQMTDRVPRNSLLPYMLVAGMGAAALAGVVVWRAGRASAPPLPPGAHVVQAPPPAPVMAAPPPAPPIVEAPPPAPPPKKKVVVEAPVTVRRHSPPAAVDPAALDEARRTLNDAKMALGSGRIAQAQALFEQVRATGLEKPAVAVGLAQIAFQKGDYSQAIKLAKGGGSGVGAKMIIGNSYLQLGQYDSAIAEYREVLRVDANHSEARTKLSQAEKRSH